MSQPRIEIWVVHVEYLRSVHVWYRTRLVRLTLVWGRGRRCRCRCVLVRFIHFVRYRRTCTVHRRSWDFTLSVRIVYEDHIGNCFECSSPPNCRKAHVCRWINITTQVSSISCCMMNVLGWPKNSGNKTPIYFSWMHYTSFRFTVLLPRCMRWLCSGPVSSSRSFSCWYVGVVLLRTCWSNQSWESSSTAAQFVLYQFPSSLHSHSVSQRNFIRPQRLAVCTVTVIGCQCRGTLITWRTFYYIPCNICHCIFTVSSQRVITVCFHWLFFHHVLLACDFTFLIVAGDTLYWRWVNCVNWNQLKIDTVYNLSCVYSVSQKKSPPGFSENFSQTVGNF